ncbi:MAG: PASTA domain-containing protein [Oscillospiraceae bacterium]|nr:PASTA domain-containing protein [Oscillospiraceae bacterium]
MKKETNLCMSCMRPPPAGVAKAEPSKECAHCGWVDKGVHLASYLYPKTFLAGRYIVGKLISYNGEAALYAGYDTLTESKISIREYMPDALCTRAKDVLPLTVNTGELPLYKAYLSEFVELNRSLQSLGSLPGIQRVADVFSENGTAYAVYEDVSGVPVKTYLTSVDGTLSPERALELFRTVFSALGRVNSAGIVHRGISPKTVFVQNFVHLGNTGVFGSNKLMPYVADFAITAARTYDSKLNSEVYAGFAAPEQYNSTDRHGEWTDVYGLAALLYNVMTGVVPQDAPSRSENDKLVSPNTLNDRIPESVAATVMNALALDVSKRIKTVGEFAKLLGVDQTAPEAGVTPHVSKHKDVPFEINIDFDNDDDEQEHESDSELTEAQMRKKAREDKKKRKMIIVFSIIGGVVLLFAILLTLALVGKLDSCVSSPPEDTAVTCDGCGKYDETCVCVQCDGCGNLIADCECTQEEHTTGCECVECNPPEVGEMRAAPNFMILNFANPREFMAELNNMYDGAFVFKYEGEFCTSTSVTVPYGTILEQSVKPGEIVEVGSEITIKFSLGKEFITLPKPNKDEKPQEYQKRLQELGVAVENIIINPEPEELDEYVEGADGTIARVAPEKSTIRIAAPYPLTAGDENKKADVITIYPAKNPPKPTEPPPEDTEEPDEPDTVG